MVPAVAAATEVFSTSEKYGLPLVFGVFYSRREIRKNCLGVRSFGSVLQEAVATSPSPAAKMVFMGTLLGEGREAGWAWMDERNKEC